MLASIGGVLGLGVAAAGLPFFTDLLRWRVSIPQSAALLAVGCSAAAGIASGLHPAVKASRLDPILALRSE